MKRTMAFSLSFLFSMIVQVADLHGQAKLTIDEVIWAVGHYESIIRDLKVDYTTEQRYTDEYLEVSKISNEKRRKSYLESRGKDAEYPFRDDIPKVITADVLLVRKGEKWAVDIKRYWKGLSEAKRKIATFDGTQTMAYSYSSNSGNIFNEYDHFPCRTPEDFGLAFAPEWTAPGKYRPLPLADYLKVAQGSAKFRDMMTIKLTGENESIGGHECIVIERRFVVQGVGQKSKLWIDPKRSFRVLRFESGYVREGRADGLPRVVIDSIELQEVQKEFWYPIKGRRLLYRYIRKGRTGIKREFIMETLLRVKKIEMNTGIDDAVFHLKYPTGARVLDTFVDHAYIAGGISGKVNLMVEDILKNPPEWWEDAEEEEKGPQKGKNGGQEVER